MLNYKETGNYYYSACNYDPKKVMTRPVTNIISFTILVVKFLFLCLLLYSCTSHNKKELEYLLTHDSIQYFDALRIFDQDTVPVTSFSFNINGENNRYLFSRNDDERYIVPYFKIKDRFGVASTWKIINDSTIEMLGSDKVIIRKHTEDTLYLINPGSTNVSTILVRIKGKFKINKESLVRRDSLYKEFIKLQIRNRNAETDTVQVN